MVSTRDDFCHPTFGDVWRHFELSQLGGGGLLLASIGYRPRMVPNALPCTRCPPYTKNCPAPNSITPRLINPEVKEEKPCSESKLLVGMNMCIRNSWAQRWRESPNIRTSHLKPGMWVAEKFSLNVIPGSSWAYQLTSTQPSLPLKWIDSLHQSIFPALRNLF